MHNPVTLTAARMLANKLLIAKAPLAVFTQYGGGWFATRTTSKLCAETIKYSPHQLVGTYNASVSIDDLADDLHHSGVK